MINTETDLTISSTLHNIVFCQMCLNKEALTNLNQAVAVKKNIMLRADRDKKMASTLLELGRCHNNLFNDDALMHLNQALKIRKKTQRMTPLPILK